MMSRRRSSSKRAKRVLKQSGSTVTQNTAKIKRPKQKKINKRNSVPQSYQTSSSLTSKVNSQVFKPTKSKDREQKQDDNLKAKAFREVAAMSKTVTGQPKSSFKNEEGFDEKRRKLDEEEYKKVEAEKQKFDTGQISEEDMYDSKYYAGHQVYLQILAMIEDAERSNNPPFMSRHANSLNLLLDKEIFNFGFDKVMKSMAEAPEELIYYARESIDASDDEISKNYRYHLMSLIEANIPTTEEAKDANDYEESVSEQTSEDYDKAEDTGWQVAGQNEIPKDWLINAENDLPDDW